jgi:hypothetical protein
MMHEGMGDMMWGVGPGHLLVVVIQPAVLGTVLA